MAETGCFGIKIFETRDDPFGIGLIEKFICLREMVTVEKGKKWGSAL